MRVGSGNGGWEAVCGHARRSHLCCFTKTRQQLFLQAYEGRWCKPSFQVERSFTSVKVTFPRSLKRLKLVSKRAVSSTPSMS